VPVLDEKFFFALKFCVCQPFAQPVVSMCPIISRVLTMRLGRETFLQSTGSRGRWPSQHHPCNSMERSLWCEHCLCFRFPVGVRPSLAQNAKPCWGMGVQGDWSCEHCDYEKLCTPASQSSRWTCLSCCQRGTLSRELIQKWKTSTRLTQAYPFPPSWSLTFS
jgi:hypothetical protein